MFGWERFLSNGDNKNNLIALSVKFFNLKKNEEYRKRIVWYVQLSQENNLIHKTLSFTTI